MAHRGVLFLDEMGECGPCDDDSHSLSGVGSLGGMLSLGIGYPAFTESIAHEVAGRGVHVHVLYPGWVPTPMGLAAAERGMRPPPRAARRTEAQVARLVLDRMGGPAIEINAAPVAVLSAVGRAFFPKVYRRALAGQGVPLE